MKHSKTILFIVGLGLSIAAAFGVGTISPVLTYLTGLIVGVVLGRLAE